MTETINADDYRKMVSAPDDDCHEVSAEEYRRIVAEGAFSPPEPSKNKYGAEPTEVDGIRFASKAEARRYGELKYQLKACMIADLEVHPEPYRLVVNGVLIGKYTPDFRYLDPTTMQTVVEDVKGKASRDYPLRKKLMLALYGIEIREVK